MSDHQFISAAAVQKPTDAIGQRYPHVAGLYRHELNPPLASRIDATLNALLEQAHLATPGERERLQTVAAAFEQALSLAWMISGDRR